MSNELSNPAGDALAALAGLKQGLTNVKASLHVSASDPYLRLGRDGTWVYGAENVEIEAGSKWAVNPLSLEHGFVAWTNVEGKQANEIVGEVMVPMTSPLPDRATLPKVEWPYSQQVGFQLKCVTGEDAGEQTFYKTTSVGGTNNVAKLIGAIMGQLDRDPEHPVPLIELRTDNYVHKKWGKTYTPVFDIVGWDSLSGTASATMAAAPVAAPAPVAVASPASAPATAEPAAAQTAGESAEARRARLQAELAELEAAPAAPANDPGSAAPAATVRRRRG